MLGTVLQTTVDDILALRDACGLSDDDVAEALRERAQRIYDKCVGGAGGATGGLQQSGQRGA